MNKTVKKVLISIILFSVLFISLNVFATETATTVMENTVNYDHLVMPISEESEGAYIPEEWRRDTVVTSDSIIDDNVFAGKEKYTLENKSVNGDMFVFAAEKLTLRNVTVTGNVFLLSDDVELENVTVSGSMYMIALNLDSKELNVQGTVYLLSEDAKIVANEMNIRDIYTFAEELNLKAIISRDLVIAGTDLKVEDGTVIGRNFSYPSDVEVEIGPNVEVKGKTETYESEVDENSNMGTSVTVETNGVKDVVLSILGSVVVSGIVLLIVVAFSEKIVKVSSIEPKEGNLFKTMGIGFLFLVVSITGMIMLLFTGVGAILSLMWLFTLIVFLFISEPIAAVAVVTALSKDNNMTNKKLYLMSILVIAILAVLDNIPLGIIGAIISFAITCLGLGTLFNVITKKDEKSKNKKVNTVVTTGKVVEESEVKTDDSKDILSKLDEIDKIDEIDDGSNK